MPQLILQPASGAAPTRHYSDTIQNAVNLDAHRDVLPPALFDELAAVYPDHQARVWGATPGPYNVPAWESMREGDIVLFYRDGGFFSSHVVSLRPDQRLPAFAERLWGRNNVGDTWECVFFLADKREETIPYDSVWNVVQIGPRTMLRGLTVVPESRGSNDVIEQFNLQRGSFARARETEEVLEAHVRRRQRGRGQGFSISPQARKALDDYAMQTATQYYVDRGYDVKNVSLNESYDLRCSKGAETLDVEVKGTQTLGEKVLLTKNEVRHARDTHPNIALFILHSVSLGGPSLAPVCSGGAMREIRPWALNDDKLEALTFAYTVGPDRQ
jgi:hypothetical protein